MKKMEFDSGIEEYQINGRGVMRFNPGDPNVYARLMEAVEKIREVEADMLSRAGEAEGDGVAVLRLLEEADRKIKETLSWVFGEENDFDQLLGVNVMSVAGNGERVITNFITALQPIIEEGAKKCAQQQVGDVVAKAEADRRQRGVQA